jgi:hypothetical protein
MDCECPFNLGCPTSRVLVDTATGTSGLPRFCRLVAQAVGRNPSLASGSTWPD